MKSTTWKKTTGTGLDLGSTWINSAGGEIKLVQVTQQNVFQLTMGESVTEHGTLLGAFSARRKVSK